MQTVIVSPEIISVKEYINKDVVADPTDEASNDVDNAENDEETKSTTKEVNEPSTDFNVEESEEKIDILKGQLLY